MNEMKNTAAPAAVAVPDELIRAAKQALACMDGLQQHLGRAVCQVEADALRAALAATPAAAATVVLPDPDAVISELMGLVDEWGMESHLRVAAELDAQHSEATQEEIDCAKDRTSKERAAWKAIESKLRALLATATGLPAQAVPYSLDLDPLGIRALTASAITGALSFGATGGEKPPAGHWLEWFYQVGAEKAPQAQAINTVVAGTSSDQSAVKLKASITAVDFGVPKEYAKNAEYYAEYLIDELKANARDAEQEVLMEHSGCGSNTQVDMLTVRLNPGDKVVMHKGRITQGFERANRAAIAAAKREAQ